MRKKKGISRVIIFAFALVGVINTITYLVNNMSICTGRFEGDPDAICYPLVSNK